MQKLPNVFNKEQLVKLFNNVSENDVMIACLLGFFCGLRLGEVTKIRIMDIDFESQRIKIVDSKNPNRHIDGYGKDRYVKMPPQIISPLKKWVEIIGNEPYLFPSVEEPNTPLSKKHLYRKYVKSLDKAGLRTQKYLDARGRPKYNYNFHTLRHSYATFLWEKTGDIYLVKEALGHSDISTTLIYAKVTDEAKNRKIDDAFNRQLNIPVIKPDPLEMLKYRLINGEISPEQYKEITQCLNK